MAGEGADEDARSKIRYQIMEVAPSIPSVDLSPFFVEEGVIVGAAPTPGQIECGKVIDAACREHGFLHATGFGLSKELSERVFSASKELFQSTDKGSLSPWHASHNMGYIPMRTESHNPSRPPEMKEAFNVQFPPAHTNDFRGTPATFANAAQELQSVIRLASKRYAIACALALGLPIDMFEKTLCDFDLCTLKYLHVHYPPCRLEETGIETDKPIRIGEHTDFGAFTFLLLGENGADGLQIKPVAMGAVGGDAGGEQDGWLDVDVPPGGAIINTGALMARWTNDEWRATAHRVIVPSVEAASRHRYSIACFVDPDSTAMVTVHDKFVTADKPCLYKPISGLAFLKMKLAEVENPKKSVI